RHYVTRIVKGHSTSGRRTRPAGSLGPPIYRRGVARDTEIGHKVTSSVRILQPVPIKIHPRAKIPGQSQIAVPINSYGRSPIRSADHIPSPRFGPKIIARWTVPSQEHARRCPTTAAGERATAEIHRALKPSSNN